MHHRFMEAVAQGLHARNVATLRFQFPYMEKGSKRPDPPVRCHAMIAAAVSEAARRTPAALFAGGRSFGGRMSSQALAAGLLPQVRGLAFLGFPLHPAGKPAEERAAHLLKCGVPMLFLQGTRDELAQLDLLQGLIARLGPRATLKLFEDADHAFHVRKSSGTDDASVLRELIGALARWLDDQSASG